MAPPIIPSARLSGLQKDVLALYRSILREAIRKDRQAASLLPSSTSTSSNNVTENDADTAASKTPIHHQHRHRLPFTRVVHSSSDNSTAIAAAAASTVSTTLSYARTKFRQEASQVRRSDFKTIEYKIRKGRKQLQLLKMPGVHVVGGT